MILNWSIVKRYRIITTASTKTKDRYLYIHCMKKQNELGKKMFRKRNVLKYKRCGELYHVNNNERHGVVSIAQEYISSEPMHGVLIRVSIAVMRHYDHGNS